MKPIKNIIRYAFNRFGYDIVRVPSPPRNTLVEQLVARGISVVLDVGANIGQFGVLLRRSGYRNRIVSFEPVSASFSLLKARAAAEQQWKAVKVALGASSKRLRINISRNSVSSSIRELEQKTLLSEPEVQYVHSEVVAIEPLDNLFAQFVTMSDRSFLKVDVQGYENELFKGARQSLACIEGVFVECSLSSLYKGEWLFPDVLAFFSSQGFFLSSIEPEFSDPETGELLQVNTLFWRNNSSLVSASGGSGLESPTWSTCVQKEIKRE